MLPCSVFALGILNGTILGKSLSFSGFGRSREDFNGLDRSISDLQGLEILEIVIF